MKKIYKTKKHTGKLIRKKIEDSMSILTVDLSVAVWEHRWMVAENYSTY